MAKKTNEEPKTDNTGAAVPKKRKTSAKKALAIQTEQAEPVVKPEVTVIPTKPVEPVAKPEVTVIPTKPVEPEVTVIPIEPVEPVVEYKAEVIEEQPKSSAVEKVDALKSIKVGELQEISDRMKTLIESNQKLHPMLRLMFRRDKGIKKENINKIEQFARISRNVEVTSLINEYKAKLNE